MKYVWLFLTLAIATQTIAKDKVLHIYQDADLSNYRESSEAIQWGIEAAFGEIGNEINGYKIVYKYLDHRGNVVRSKRNYQSFIDDPSALAIFSGIHSPPLIKNRAYINENKALTLVPWAAGGPITRHPSTENWVFRLSIDDTQAGPVIINHALNKLDCSKPHLVLEDTPWGDSNLRTMTVALQENEISSPSFSRFSWNLKEAGARTLLRKIVESGHDCIVLVANAIEGAVIVKEMVELSADKRMPIVSHWGITGGNFHDEVTAADRAKIDLHFIQTCFAFTSGNQSEFAQKVLSRLKLHTNGSIKKPSDLKAAVGFIHAYDLTRILIRAIENTGLTGNIQQDRDAIRLALENIDNPVQGLIKTYFMPFSKFNHDTNYDAHEALNAESYCMGQYGNNNEIVIASD